MRRGICCAGLVALIVCAASAQTAALQTQAASPVFDVASVKPAAPITDGRIMVRMNGGPGSSDPGQITYTNVSMKNLLTTAYNVKGYQISGPPWLEGERYDIVAKIPKGATKEEFQIMLQNLLAERFKLTLHRETKDLPIYALVVGKNGVKMKESPKDDPALDASGGPPSSSGTPPPPPSGSRPMAGGSSGQMRIGKDGMPPMPPGAGRGSMMRMMMTDGGRMRLQANKQSTSAIVEMLANQLGRPVVDQTGLKANYDYTLDFAPEDARQMPGMAGISHPPPPDGGTASSSSEGANGPGLTTAIQEQLGLKLEPKKGPIDLLVIDRLEKIPTEN